MIKLKITWWHLDTAISSIGKRKQKTLKISTDDFIETFKKIEELEGPIWADFEYYLLKVIWKDKPLYMRCIKIYYNGVAPKDVFMDETKSKAFYLQVLRDSKLNDLI